jgi:aspartate aminotransferase-like enzyme
MKNLKKLIEKKNKDKIIFTAGPASLLVENISNIQPCFGRGDKEYLLKEKFVLDKILKLSGQKTIARMQGSGSLALEIMATNFLYGKVLIIDTGYYSDRLFYLSSTAKKNFKKIKKIKKIKWKQINEFSEKYDWIFACSTETSCGLKIPINDLYKLKKRCNSKLMLDATASIGLEENHELCDVLGFSSCKGLFGLTGACFVAFSTNPKNEVNSFYLNIYSHLNKKMTGPYHIIYSLYDVLKNHSNFAESVKINKRIFLKKMDMYLSQPLVFQPNLCTHVTKSIGAKNNKVILYEPRNDIGGSVVCHIGEAHLGKNAKGEILKNLKI